jgi:hypothetical protein
MLLICVQSDTVDFCLLAYTLNWFKLSPGFDVL